MTGLSSIMLAEVNPPIGVITPFLVAYVAQLASDNPNTSTIANPKLFAITFSFLPLLTKRKKPYAIFTEAYFSGTKLAYGLKNKRTHTDRILR